MILCKEDRVEKVRKLIGFDAAFTVDCRGHSGGIALLWRHKQEATLMSYSKNHIDVVIDLKGWNKYRLTGLYGEPDRAKRKETWELICRLHNQSDLPWVLIGDMNNVVKQQDKRGGRPYPSWLIQGFQKCLEDCELHDIDREGYPYTWERGQGTPAWTQIRLDRALASHGFMNQFADVKLTNLKISISDHSPILLEPFLRTPIIKTNKFCFENAWLRDPICGKIVEEAWKLNQGKTLTEKLSFTSELLARWGKEITGSFKSRI